ncbi:MAG: M23 family metallopeptidase [Hyphomicrobiaceae bacterium]|nr:M23 family metallopeptidase [Hyphomicrobiaceae bacterium]
MLGRTFWQRFVGVMVACAAIVGATPAAHAAAGVGSAGEAGAVTVGRPVFSLPIDCAPGRTCFIQNNVDMQPGTGAADFRCGSTAYDGHTGVDFRLHSLAAAAAGVEVRAAAPGVVKATREGMADRVPPRAEHAAMSKLACGNAVIVDHGGGWRTIYCHLRRGSVRVRSGDRVTRGQPLGLVGYSGIAEFAHLHFEVRHRDTVVDPSSGNPHGTPCRATPDVTSDAASGSAAASLWSEDVRTLVAYRNGEIIAAGFAGAEEPVKAMEKDHAVPPPTAASEVLLFYVRAINLKRGDRVTIKIRAPDGRDFRSFTQTLGANKAVSAIFTGKRRTKPRWMAGRYVGSVEITRGAAVIARREGVTLDIAER